MDKLFYALIGKNEKGCLTPSEFLKFLTNVQKEKNADLALAKKIIAEVEQKGKGHIEENLYVTGFASYLCSPKYCNIFNTAHTNVYQDMTQPLSHYWIASSHNT